MRIVIYALLPTVALHVVFFGAGLLVQIVLGAATALISEALALRLRRKPLEPFLKDGSAIVTAMLLALCLPPLAPWWLVVSGTAFAVLLAKHLYGGLGANPFNPAMVGYAVLLVSFPVQLLQWLPPAGMDIEHAKLSIGETIQTILTGSLPSRLTWDAVTSPTPLDALRTNLKMGMTMAEAQAAPIFGALGGRGWEWINLATLAGGLALLQLRIIRWHIPVAMLGAIVVYPAGRHQRAARLDAGDLPAAQPDEADRAAAVVELGDQGGDASPGAQGDGTQGADHPDPLTVRQLLDRDGAEVDAVLLQLGRLVLLRGGREPGDGALEDAGVVAHASSVGPRAGARRPPRPSHPVSGSR
jgi:RnfABCDGE-type electron transport complex D subunit